MNIGVIGCGYWGAKHARVLSELPNARLHSVADMDNEKVQAITEKYEGVQGLNDVAKLLENPEIDGVIIATPASSHYQLALQALQAGKHAMVEKPLTLLPEQAQNLINTAQQSNLKLMVGHTFEYHPTVHKLREIVAQKELGDLYYLDMARLNLGLYQRDVNVIYDLSPHDISIMLYVLHQRPVEVTARGYSMVHGGVVDVAYVEYRFPTGIVANSRVSWLAPRKTRELTIVGSQRMVVYDDATGSNVIQLFDKNILPPRETEQFAEWKFAYQYGDTTTLTVSGEEPLKSEISHFIDCITRDLPPQTGGENGRTVVSVLHAAQLSLQNGGRPQLVEYYDEPVANFEKSGRYWAVGANARRIASYEYHS